MMAIPLEDNILDIIGKAQRGLGLAESSLAEKAGVPLEALRQVRDGEADPETLRKIAPVLGLGPEALVACAQKAWQPAEIGVPGLAAFNTPFEDMTVNAYLVWDEATKEAAAFDTGADCSSMLEGLVQHGLTLKAILLTHTHGDHIFDLDRLQARTGAPAYVSAREAMEGAESIAEGRVFQIGNLGIRAILTWGHSRGGLTYFVEGLSRPVAIVGDSLFAGSMGGGMVSYAEALRNNREKILTLPEETIVCPGHGPLTTVADEKAHNPFFAGH